MLLEVCRCWCGRRKGFLFEGWRCSTKYGTNKLWVIIFERKEVRSDANSIFHEKRYYGKMCTASSIWWRAVQGLFINSALINIHFRYSGFYFCVYSLCWVVVHLVCTKPSLHYYFFWNDNFLQSFILLRHLFPGAFFNQEID